MAKYIMPYNSETGDKEGYARYAIRFSGGGYLHGTPINYDEEINKEFFMKQKKELLELLQEQENVLELQRNMLNFYLIG